MISYLLISLYAFVLIGICLRPKVIFYIFPILALFDNTRIFIVTPSEFAMICIVLIATADFLMNKHSSIVSQIMPNFIFFMSIYLTWILLNSLYHIFPFNNIINIPYFSLLKDTMKAVLGFLFVLSCSTFLKDEHDLHRIITCILIGQAIAIIAALGCMLFLGSPTALRTAQDFFTSTEGFQGTILRNPNMYSRYLYFSFPILIAFLSITKGEKRIHIFVHIVWNCYNFSNNFTNGSPYGSNNFHINRITAWEEALVDIRYCCTNCDFANHGKCD